jgi:DNA primase
VAFPELFLDELTKKNDIAEIVEQYVRLPKRTGGNLFGLCPFHSEKTPSFSVNVEKQIYHCFGCGKGGGVINFVMEIENLSYPDAVRLLAKRVGMTVPDDKASLETQGKRTRLLELNKDAARFFYSVLTTPQGDAAMKYISKRGISMAMVKKFGLGAAPDSWTALYDAMTKKGYTRQDLLEARLVKISQRDNNSVYDVFRNRLMFPVIDVRGYVIGFSGRILGDGEPKYLNSPETPVFEKSRNLFALNIAKKTKSGMLILTEGNIDVVALHQAGFDCAVASLGTSLTEPQVRLMSQYSNIKSVVIAYDADAAGVKAASRAISLLEKANLDVRVLRMEGAKDPDEYIKKFGADAFDALLKKSENELDYRLMTIRNKHGTETDEGRLKYLEEATALLSKVDSAVKREIYGAKIAEAAGVTADAVKNEIKKAFKKRITAEKKKTEQRELDVKVTIQPADRSIRYDNEYSAVAEEGVIRLLANDSELFKVAEELNLVEEDFTSPFLRHVYGILRRRKTAGLESPLPSVLAELEKAEASQFTKIMQKPEILANADKAMKDYIDKIRTEKIRKSSSKDNDKDKENAILESIEKLKANKLNKETNDRYGQSKYRDQ